MASNYSKPSRQVSKLKKSKPYDKAKPIGKRKPFEKAAPYEAGKLKDKYKTGLWQEEADNDDINLIEGRNPVLEALKSG